MVWVMPLEKIQMQNNTISIYQESPEWARMDASFFKNGWKKNPKKKKPKI